MRPLVNMAVMAARQAGEIIRRSYAHIDRLEIISKNPNDFCTQVDKASEAVIVEMINRSFPKHGILAEEGSSVRTDNERLWIIDPLDGTTNFIHGFPMCCISIGFQYKGELEHAVVYQPFTDEIFTATKGEGAFLNQRRLHVSKAKGLEGSLLCTGFPYREKDPDGAYFSSFKQIYEKCGDVRRTGTAALDLCYVAAGRFDGYWEKDLKVWDVAAGTLIVREAGGVVTDYQGNTQNLTGESIIAATPKCYEGLFEVLK